MSSPSNSLFVAAWDRSNMQASNPPCGIRSREPSMCTGSPIVSDDDSAVMKEFNLDFRLGEGAYGTVYAATHIRTNKRFAIKVMQRSSFASVEKQMLHEAVIMQSLRHCHVVQFLKLLRTKSEVYFVMSLAEGGELFDLIIHHKRFYEHQARKYFQQLMSALWYCHNEGVAHRDLKAENLLLDKNGNLVVCDFGFSSKMLPVPEDSESPSPHGNDYECGMPEGTIHYMTPEAIQMMTSLGNSKRVIEKDPFSQDLWAAGVILFFMLTGELPFHGRDDEETMFLIEACEVNFGLVPSAEASEYLSKILRKDPMDRLTLKQMIEDPWFVTDLPLHLFPQGHRHVEDPSSPSDHSSATPSVSGSRKPSHLVQRNAHTQQQQQQGLTPLQQPSSECLSAIGRSPSIPVPSFSFASSAPQNQAPNTLFSAAQNCNPMSSSMRRQSSRHFLDFSHSPEESLSPTEEEEIVIRKAFSAIDMDGYGDHFTIDELRDTLITLKKSAVDTDEVHDLYHLFTDNNNGIVTYDAFRNAWINKDLAHSSHPDSQIFQLYQLANLTHTDVEKNIVRQLRDAFDSVDELHTGVISFGQWKRIFEKAQMPVSDEELKGLLVFWNATFLDGSGCISFEDFVAGIVKRDILLKHPLGKKLACATNLGGFAELRNLDNSVSSGFVVLGMREGIADKLLLSHPDRLAVQRKIERQVPSELIVSLSYLRDPIAPPSTSHSHHYSHTHHHHHATGSGGCCSSSSSVLPVGVAAANISSSAPLPIHHSGHAPTVESPRLTSPTSTTSGHHCCCARKLSRGAHWRPLMSEHREDHTTHVPSVTTSPYKGPISSSSTGPGSGGGCTCHGTSSSTGCCEVDVILSPTSCFGYTLVKLRRITGPTADFHEAVKFICALLEKERDQACLDICVRGDSELM